MPTEKQRGAPNAVMAVLADGQTRLIWAAVFRSFLCYARKSFEIALDLGSRKLENQCVQRGLLNRPSADHANKWRGTIQHCDMAIWRGTGSFVLGALQRGEFLDVETYSACMALGKRSDAAPAFCASHGQRAFGEAECQLQAKRHRAAILDLADTNKIAPESLISPQGEK